MALILIVEDNPANLKLAKLLLLKVGHSVLTAADAEAGLALALSEHPELILMDIQLPGMDGLTATSILKADPATAAIPVIALTAMAMKSDEDKSRLAGCDGYIAKPLRFQELYDAIDELLARSGPPDLPLPAPLVVASPSPAPRVRIEVGIDSSGAEALDNDRLGIPTIDMRVLERQLGTDAAVLVDILDMFQESTADIGHILVHAVLAGDAPAAGLHAHKLMSSARAVGAIELGNLCASMEAAGRSNRLSSLSALLAPLEIELRSVHAAIRGVRESFRSILGEPIDIRPSRLPGGPPND